METQKAIALVAEILDVMVGHFTPDCGGDFAEYPDVSPSRRRSMTIKIGDTVVLNSRHVMEGKLVKIVGEVPPPWAKMWEAVVVDGTARTWVMPDQIERKL